MPEMKELSVDYWSGAEETQWEGLVSLKLLTRNTRLVETRKAKGLTQMEAARLIGHRTEGRLSQIENLRRVPTATEQYEISKLLEKPIDYLFPDILMRAIEEGVFERRDAQLVESEIISLTEAQRLRLTYDGETQMIEEIERKLLKKNLNEILGELKPVERAVLEIRFGFNGHPLTLKETAELLGWRFWNRKPTRERIRQIEAKALRKLRHPARSRLLKDYLD